MLSTKEAKNKINKAIIQRKKMSVLYEKENGEKKKYLIKKVISNNEKDKISIQTETNRIGFDKTSFHTPILRYDRFISIDFINEKLEISEKVGNEAKIFDITEYEDELKNFKKISGYTKIIITNISDGDGGEYFKEGLLKPGAFRIKFIDAPEMNEKDKELKQLAKRSYEKLLKLIPPKTVVYIKEYGKDLNGRLLVEIFYWNFKENVFYNIGSILLEEGLAITLFIDDGILSKEKLKIKIKEYSEYSELGYKNNLGIRNNLEINQYKVFEKSLEIKKSIDINGKNILQKVSFIGKYKYKKSSIGFIISNVVGLDHYDFQNFNIKKGDSINLNYYKDKDGYKDVIRVSFNGKDIGNIPDPHNDFGKKFISINNKNRIIKKMKELDNYKIEGIVLLVKNNNKKDLKIKIDL